MEPIVYTIKDVAELLQCSESSVNNLRERGILREVKGLPGVRFNRKEIEALVGIVDEYSPLQYRKLEKERDELLQENEKLKMSIRKITSDLLVMVGGELKLWLLLWNGLLSYGLLDPWGALKLIELGLFNSYYNSLLADSFGCALMYTKKKKPAISLGQLAS